MPPLNADQARLVTLLAESFIWCKKVQTTVNSRAKMYANTALALEFSTLCKLECKCGIYHLGL